MAQIFLLALAAATFPVLLAAVLVVLTLPEPEGQLAALLAGGMTVSLISGTAILVVLDAAGVLQSSGGSTNPAVDIVLGAIAVLAGLVMLAGLDRRLAARRPAPAERGPSWTERTLGRGSRKLAFLAGVVLCLPNIYYLAALKDMSIGDYSTTTLVLLLLAFNLIMFISAELPLAGFALAGDRTRPVVARLGNSIRAHQRQVIIAMALVFGTYLLIKGLAGS
ncbi:GAP family protein [Conexibacter woesei]|uniref:GAP family protein n=1 Tax=Conexibacter woesei TaxID=191495 RepID=UPI0003FFBD81|nr:GAP family protein [Conexibacter woesei]